MPSDPELDDVLSRLSITEKVSLLSAVDWWRTPTIYRNGEILVPNVKSSDGPNGARGESYVSGVTAACFPNSTCLGASFDVDVAFQTGRYIAMEALSKAAKILLAPTVNMIRSPIAGRNYETFSEDPWVLGMMGAAYVRGSQSVGVAATPKHFVANDVEKRRRFLTAEVDERTLREIYLLPFQLIVKLSKPWCFMTSYNRVNGTYCAEDPRLLQTILRDEWGFDGLVMSDWVGTYSTVEAINAGLDLEMPGPTKKRGDQVLKALETGEILEQTVDTSARRLLQLLNRLGRFDDPSESPEKALVDGERDAFIARSAAESTVLLKNDGNILPLSQGAKVVIIGQHAHTPTIMGGGSARVKSARIITPLMGLTAANVDFEYEPGVPVFNAVPVPAREIISPTSKVPEITKPVRLEWFNGSTIGENVVNETFLESTEYMIKEQWPGFLKPEYCTRMSFTLTPKTSGEHTLSVLTTGTATLYINGEKAFHREQDQHLQREAFYFFRAKFERRFTFPMQAGKSYTFRLESWATDPDALARSIGGAVIQGSGVQYFEYTDVQKQIRQAAAAAAKADVAIVFTGTTSEIESEGYDRDDMSLTSDQYRLIDAVTEANAKTVVVNYSGSPVDFTPFISKAAGLLQCWFPGQECGQSIAKLLTGEVNPCGRLPMSWPQKLEDNPSHANFPTDDHDVIRYEEGVGVGYRYYDRSESPNPLFPFGFGLSYTSFVLGETYVNDVPASDNDIGRQVSTTVRNTGSRDGKVVIQFYVQPPLTTVQRPIKELKAFQKAFVRTGHEEVVSVLLDKYSVSYYDTKIGSWVAEAGRYTVHVGFSTEDILKSVPFDVIERIEWTGV